MVGRFEVVSDNSKEVGRVDRRGELWSLGLFVGLGLAMGATAKWLGAFTRWDSWVSDVLGVLGNLGSGFGVWIFVGVLIVMMAGSAKWAAAKVPAFLFAMLLAYYVVSVVMVDYLVWRIVLGWGFFAVMSGVGAYLLWNSMRGERRVDWVVTALPIGMVLAHMVPAYRMWRSEFLLQVVFVVILLLVMKRKKEERLRLLAWSVGVGILLVPVYGLVFEWLLGLL